MFLKIYYFEEIMAYCKSIFGIFWYAKVYLLHQHKTALITVVIVMTAFKSYGWTAEGLLYKQKVPDSVPWQLFLKQSKIWERTMPLQLSADSTKIDRPQ